MRHLQTVVVFVVLVSVSAVSCSSDGSIAADEAHIEMIYSDDGTSYIGDRTIVEGTATVIFSNDSDDPLRLDVFGYETGSEALDEELAFLHEGTKGVPSGVLPVAGFFRVASETPQQLEPGRQTWTMDLVPGTYIFDVSAGAAMVDGLWRAAVIEVVAG